MQKKMLLVVVGILSLLSVAHASAPIWSATGFMQPESVLFDRDNNQLIVSNINGHPGEADGNGFISLLNTEGEPQALHWVDGLDAPKGMAIVGPNYLVADLTKLRVINRKTGELEITINVQGAEFLNDVTSDGEVAWISDLMTHSIYKYEKGRVSLWMKNTELNHPNGVFYDNNRLLVGSWGQNMQDDFSTEIAGDLLSIDINTKSVEVLAKSIGNLDGVTKIENTLFVNDWITGVVYQVSEAGEVVEWGRQRKGLADIAKQGEILLFPFMLGNTVEAYRVKK